MYYSLEHMQPASQGGTFDPEGYINAMKRMKTLVTDTRFIVPWHDGKIFSNFPVVKEGVVKIE